ncbi:MAG: UbiA family prenyltransferase [Candidatus Tectomicrobia bacterium]|nr:UbiA family prenyltransferase [Candidatus Tectomicrobia bacterium]
MVYRWWIYQRERFPVFAHGPLIAVFSLSAICFSLLLRGKVEFPTAQTVLVGFVSVFLFFLQLRIADEFKDYEDDARYRPYRPVPRGLISLRELGVVGFISALIQSGLALWLSRSLVPLLAIVWVYMVLMSKEFFVPRWLKAHPLVYMLSHMLIMPLIYLYTTACDWRVAQEMPPEGVAWFLGSGFFNGLVIEIGRKIRAPEDEEHGVETYSFLWSCRNAVMAWLGALFLTAISASVAASQIDFAMPVAWLVSILFMAAVVIAWRFLGFPGTERAKMIEQISGVWTLLLYLSLGVLPLLWRL